MSQDDGSGVLVTYQRGLQIVEFNNPRKRNAWSSKSYVRMREALEEGARRDDVCLTVFTHRGSVYSAGNDFSSALTAENPSQLLDQSLDNVRRLVDQMIDYPKVLVAVLDGGAVGIACTTLPLFDLVFASTNSWFYTPFARLGVVPEGCSSYTFPRLMGHSRASLLLYLGEKVFAPQAERCGLVTEVFQTSQRPLIMSRIETMASLPKQALLEAKRLVREPERAALHSTNRREMAALREACLRDEFFEAVAASFKPPSSKL